MKDARLHALLIEAAKFAHTTGERASFAIMVAGELEPRSGDDPCRCIKCRAYLLADRAGLAHEGNPTIALCLLAAIVGAGDELVFDQPG